MMFGLLSLILLGPVGYVLMYGAFGLPSLGARGSGIASAIVCWAQAGAYLAFVRFAPCYPGVRWDTASWRPDWPTIRGVLRLGAPMAASLLMEASLFSVAGLMIGGLGEVAVASHQIALNVASVAFMVPLGLAMAITVRVGNAIGRGDPRAARRAGLVGIALVLLTQLCSSSVMFGAPLPIAHIYTHDAAVLAGAATLLWFAGVFQFSDGLQVAASGALRGLKDTEVPMLITGLAYWGVGMPLGWWLGLRHGFGAQGVWTGLIAGLTVAAVLLLTRFVTLSRVGVPGRRWGMRLRAES
jgi:MATE family multidrug resistance protein